MKQVVVYPSGFIGYSVGWPIAKTDTNFDAAQALARYANVLNREKISVSNDTVETLFLQWRTHARRLTDAEFISDIVAAVANAFGTDSFYEWCHMQLSSPYFTADHRQYLNETLHFLDGRSRDYSHFTWIKSLELRRATPADADEKYDYQEVMLRWGMEQTTVLKVLSRWMSRPNGVEDMLSFAHLIFGDNDR